MLRSRLISVLLVWTFLIRGPLAPPVAATAAPRPLPPSRVVRQAAIAQFSVPQLWRLAQNQQPTAAKATRDATRAPRFYLPESVLQQIQALATPTPVPAAPSSANQPDQVLGFPVESEHYGGCNPSEPSTTGSCADPIDTLLGNFWKTYSGLAVPGRGPGLQFLYSYNSRQAANASTPGVLGYGWTHNYNLSITGQIGSQYAYVHQENDSVVKFDLDNGKWIPAGDRAQAQLVQIGSDWVFTRTHSLDRFEITNGTHLTKITDRNGYTTTLTYTSTNSPLQTVTDAAGRTLTFTYNGAGRLTKVHDDTGNREVSFSYNMTNELASVIDVAGKQTDFTYDNHHRILTITDPQGGVITNTYQTAVPGSVLSQTDALGHTTEFQYENDCFLFTCTTLTTTVTSPLGHTTQYVYEYVAQQLKKLIRDPGTSLTQKWLYRFSNSLLLSVTDPMTHTWVYTWSAAVNGDGNQGDLLATTDPLNRTTRATYNTLHEPLVITDARQMPIIYTYDISGNLTSITRPITETAQTVTSTFGYNPARPGDILTITNTLGNQWRFAYNANGYIISSTTPLTATTIYTPDNIGRVLNVLLPSDTTSTTVAYNAWGGPTRITDTLGYTTVYTYDGNRNITDLEDPNHRVIHYKYNHANQLGTITRPDGTHSDYGYDADGNVVSQTNALTQTTRYSYDALERLISSTDPLTRTTVYTYDRASRLIALEDPLARQTDYGYDNANQITGIEYSDGTTPNVDFAYNAVGQRTIMTDGIGTTQYSYDSLGRVTQVQQPNARTVRYGYDVASRLIELGYPDLSSSGILTATHSYNNANQLISVTDWQTQMTQFVYDPKGNLTDITYPNGAVARLGYDAANQVITMTQSVTATPFLSLTYTLDAGGLLATAAEQRGTAARDQHGYEYDRLNRLTGDDLSINQTISRTWGYDGATEITQTSYSPFAGWPTTGVRTYDAANELKHLVETSSGVDTADWGFTYDANGNRTAQEDKISGTKHSYSYDQADRLTSYDNGAWGYGYNGDGLRMYKVGFISFEDYTWDVNGGLPLLLQDNNTSYLYGPSGLLIEQMTAGGTATYAHEDRLGSVRALTDGSGAVVRTADYDAYGQPVSTSGSGSTPFGFAGEYTDAETGFLYLRARYYSPATQQFVTHDPVSSVTGQPYNYADGSPVNKIDPTGLGAIGLCVGVNGTLQIGRGGGANLCFVISSAGEWGIQFSPNGYKSSVGGSVGATVGLQTSLAAQNLSDLEGPFAGLGGAGGEDFLFSCDIAGGLNSNGDLIDSENWNIGIGAGLEGHFGTSSTYTLFNSKKPPSWWNAVFNQVTSQWLNLNPGFQYTPWSQMFP